MQTRKNIRLKNYDYSQQGAYFVTICTDEKRCILARVSAGSEFSRASVTMTKLGEIAEKTLFDIETRYGIHIPAYVVMPNHIHMIIELDSKGKSAGLGEIVGGYKSLVVYQWRNVCRQRGLETGKVWQRNYYEHILRNEKDYFEKCRYIDENPDKWSLDEMYVK